MCLQSLAEVFRCTVGKADKSDALHFYTQELFLASAAVCDKTKALPPNAIIQWMTPGELEATHFGR